MQSYACLNQNHFKKGDYEIVPIRFEDRYEIMKWRNDQKYHLRQKKTLIKQDQDLYFNTILKKGFDSKEPAQIIFSYLEKNKCVGYGGLVHIDWRKKYAEISFIMDTELEHEFFSFHWSQFLNLIEKVAFNDLDFRRIFTHAYNIRPHLYKVLLKNNYNEESKIKSDNFEKSRYSLIHSKISKKIELVKANQHHIKIAYNWLNDPNIRKFSYNNNKIDFESHKSWYLNKINDKKCIYFFLKMKKNICGSIRFDEINGEYKISYLIDKKFHGLGLGKIILFLGTLELRKKFKNKVKVYGDVIKENYASVNIFKSLSFTEKFLNKNNLRFEKLIL